MTIEPRIACEPAATVVETAHADAELRSHLRRRLIYVRLTIPADARVPFDAAITRNLLTWLQCHPAPLLGVYWPIRGEPDLRDAYLHLAASGVRLALPRMAGKGLPLDYAAWTPGDRLVVDRWGIATPAATVLVKPEALLIPCVGFNQSCYRLGYGGGFYDRTLAEAPRPRALGIAYECARADFTAEAHDIAMDAMITEMGVFAGSPMTATPESSGARSP